MIDYVLIELRMLISIFYFFYHLKGEGQMGRHGNEAGRGRVLLSPNPNSYSSGFPKPIPISSEDKKYNLKPNGDRVSPLRLFLHEFGLHFSIFLLNKRS
jgi:hypothetical protein